MAGFFKFVDVVPEAPTAAVGGSGLLAKAMGVVGFVAVAALESLAEPESQDAGWDHASKSTKMPEFDDISHSEWDLYWGK
jgi:hypothetical protein